MPGEPLAPRIEPAELLWHDGVPESARFGDVYFSRENGLDESRHVFLDHNHLAARFPLVPKAGHFVIAETGFGTGLNFLASWLEWRKHRPEHPATLHFVSVERYPLTREDLATALSFWPELAPLADELIHQYPPLIRGVHRLALEGGKVRLTLYFGDVLDAWAALRFQADAWFLDGFAPAMNPEMWLDESIRQIGLHSKPGTTLATFTSVGRIRRALTATGFEMRKARGFGRKREMLAGRVPGKDCPVGPAASKPVAVIGAGIAGCLLARNLADRGIPVVLLDAAERAGTAASGNRQGAMYVKLAVEFNDQAELALTALAFSQRFYGPMTEHFHPTGLLQLAWNPQELDRQQRFLERNDYPPEILRPVGRAEASQPTGIPVQSGGLWFPACGWLKPANLCHRLSEHPLIERVFDVTVDSLVRMDGGWQLSGQGLTNLPAGEVIICAGHRTPALLPSKGESRLKSIRGQVTHLRASSLRTPHAVVCGARYLNPAHNGLAVTGATFDLRDHNPEPTEDSHRENLRELDTMLPGVLHRGQASVSAASEVDGRVAFRCTTHDYQPVAGSLPATDGKAQKRLFVFTGLGSKGLTYAPLLAEYLADLVTGQPACLPERLAHRIRPGRILISNVGVS